MKSKRSALAAGINTSLWIASADTSRLWFPPGISERNPPARLREGVVVSGVSAPPAPHVGPGPPRSRTRCTPRTLQGHTCRAGVQARRTRGDTRGHTRRDTHTRGHTRTVPLPGARERRASRSLGQRHAVLPLAGGSWRAAQRGAGGAGLRGAGGARPALARAGGARCRPVPPPASGAGGAGPPGAARRQ